MITLVNAITKHFAPLSLNLPSHKLIAITGNKHSVVWSLINDIIFKEAQYRHAAAEGVFTKSSSSNRTTSWVQFISGLPRVVKMDTKFVTINLKNAIDSGLRGVLYILDHPSESLNENETTALIHQLYALKNLGNTVIIAEKNIQCIKNAEYIVEIDAIKTSTRIVFQGKTSDLLQQTQLNLAVKINSDKSNFIVPESNVFDLYNPLVLNQININNINGVTVEIPFNRITSIVGVAGTGKSTIAFDAMHSVSQYLLKEITTNSKLNNKKSQAPKVDVKGMLPTFAIGGVPVKHKKNETVGLISGIDAKLCNLFEKVNQNNTIEHKVFGTTKPEMNAISIQKLLMEFRKQVVVHQSFSTNITEQKALQILAGGIINHLDILDKLGLGYLTLSRMAGTLSNGEAKRVHLSTAMAQDISGVCFVLNEPTSGLHPSDLDNLFFMLYELKRQGNTVVVCENNAGFIRYSDHVIELGSKTGNRGGELIYEGDVKTLLGSEKSIVRKYLSTDYSFKRQLFEPDFKNTISIKKAFANNLKHINIDIPTRSLVVISGVSGSGKSSLMNEVIYKSYQVGKATNCSEIDGFQHFKKVVFFDYNFPKGKYKLTVAEYLGISDSLKNDSKAMNSSLRELTAAHDYEVSAKRLLMAFILDYLVAGQKLETLDVAEKQRLKLVKTLLESANSPILYLLDEPTAGLHMQDVEKLLTAFDYILKNGHSIIAIEHHKTLIENADYLIELGPEAGDEGGQVV